jgi:aldehyde dehydrogenase (NAD+)
MNPGGPITFLSNSYLILPSATGGVITSVPEGTLVNVEAAVAAARRAFETVWGLNTPGDARGHLLYKLAELMVEHADRIAALEALDVGKTFIHARHVDVDIGIKTVRYFAGWADKNHGKVIEVSEPSTF